MSGRRWLFYFWVAVLLALVGYLSYRTGQMRQEIEPAAVPSSYRWSPSGAAAFYTLLRDLDYPVRRWHRSYHHLEGTGGLLIALEPGSALSLSANLSLSPGEEQALRGWIEAGNCCLLSAETVAAPDLAGGGTVVAVPPELCVEQPDPPLSGIFEGVPLERLPAGAPLPLFDGLSEIFAAHPDSLAGEEAGDLATAVTTRLQASSGDMPLWADAYGALLVEQRLGEGRLYVLASASPIMNDLLGRGDNARYAARLVQSLWDGKGEILFDEYHHGYQERRTLLWWLLRPERRPLLAQTGLVLLLAVFALAVYFGRPVPYTPLVERRTSAEYIEALAGLYQRAGVRTEIAAMLERSFRERLARALRAPLTASWERLAQAASARRPEAGETIMRLTSALPGALQAFNDDSLTSWSREMEEAVREVEGSRQQTEPRP